MPRAEQARAGHNPWGSAEVMLTAEAISKLLMASKPQGNLDTSLGWRYQSINGFGV